MVPRQASAAVPSSDCEACFSCDEQVGSAMQLPRPSAFKWNDFRSLLFLLNW